MTLPEPNVAVEKAVEDTILIPDSTPVKPLLGFNSHLYDGLVLRWTKNTMIPATPRTFSDPLTFTQA